MNSNPEKKEGGCPWGRRCWRIPFLILGIVLIKSAVVLGLWNWLVPELFHGPAVNYLQAIGIVVLSKLLFWGGPRHGQGPFCPPWKRWEGLSAEDRAKLREEIRSRCE